MSEKHQYVRPPKTKKHGLIGMLKDIYSNLHPDYWKRKLPHLLIVVPVIWLIDSLIILSFFSISRRFFKCHNHFFIICNTFS